jgi:transposase InsO family protein
LFRQFAFSSLGAADATTPIWQAGLDLVAAVDAFSRKVIGWALDDRLEARLAAQALDMALLPPNPPADSLIHHSDRGAQHACGDYTERLEAHEIAISMSRVANPYDNAKAESFMKTLKAEELNGKAYATLDQARREIGAFIETVYNAQRPHSALGYQPSVEFEAELNQIRNRQPKAETALSLN